jgi:multidrug efflux system membrane fusion protein
VGQGSVSSLTTRPRLIAAVITAAIVVAVFAGLITTRYTRDATANVPPAVAAGVPVSVGLVKAQSVHPFAEFSGRITAVDYAQIKPQVSGRITEIRFRDGQHVNAGDILFVIDPRPYQAAVDKAQADLQTAIHNAKYAKA